ncbi:phage tail spike protein [Bacillus thuringiensis]|jgi:phage minor structural protein|uniref:phage tail spike protein n=2 Tax=Bacillus thuringiensis TaxID=1428 RepID=UPI0015804FD5|nr:phage tail spike protein [Bacillus thuringiensis]MDA2234036.1 tail fiber domain-containing protein [Bacillus cereus]NUH91266.1 tail fiber domain-containing protein [Bacillus thuringiensis]NUH92918.1 tail fiber domain-containing protein [Bacillus thuringiensis]NUI01836.1 tail fiber domain-containing protein [Bacillus thuringiensis]NUI07148.1 tail fiber domain-containing protein [Bacillus thuringiensis]
MRTPSGILHVVDFKTDQIVAVIQPNDYWDDNRRWELKNNVDMLDFTVFDGTTHSATLQQQNLVLKEVRDGRVVPYVITETEKNSDKRSITTYASGAWVQIAKSGIIKPQRIEGKTVNEFIDMALVGMKWKRGKTDYAGFHTMTIDEFMDPLTFLKKIASLFKLEIQYRVEVQGSQIVGWYVDMIQRRGRDTGKEIELGKDLIGVTRIEHSRDICTALVGFVKGEGDNVITIESINRGFPYIVDKDAFQRWNERGKHKFGFYTPETEELDMTPKRLMTLMEIELKKRVNSSVSYEVEAQSIGRIFGLAHELINEGDTIRIKDTGFTPKLYLEARVIAGDESFTDPTQDKYVFGDYREITDSNEELRKIYNRILGSLGNKQELIDQLDKLVKDANETASNAKKESEAAKTLAEKVQENLKNNTVDIIEAKNPPTTGLKPYKTLWRDISNGKPGILKIWTDAAWESVVPDVESVKKETLEQVNKDIESTKTELNQKVQETQNQATGQFNEIKESLQGVNRTISNIENKQGEIDKKVTKFEQDSNGFKTSIESLTKKDTEISNKLNTVESNAEGTKRAISDVQQTTSELKKTTTEIEEKAGKISEKLTNVETKVNSDKTGGRNLLLKSNVKYEKTDYLINQYSLTENFFAGEEYTFVIKGSVPQGQKFGIWQNGGSSNVGYATSVYANGITYLTFKAVVATSGNERKLSLYNYPSSTTKSIVEWVALYKGNKPQDWTAPPEEQVTTDEFTKKTTEIEKSVDVVKNTVTSVQNSQAGFEKRMTIVEQTATGLSSTVSNLNNVVSDQGKKLTEANSKLEQQATAIGAKVELKQVENYVAGFKIPELKQTVDKNKQDLLGELANKLATEQFNQKMTLIDNRFTINEQGINASAKKTEVYTKDQANGQFATSSYVRDMETRLQLTEKGVSISVKENDVIAAFNMSKENITLNANRINLVGFITANHIKGKVLEGVTLKTSGNRFVEINKQDMKIFDLDKPRGYIGFMETNDGSIQPSLVLGSDNRKYAGTGSFYIYQVMPRINGVDQPSKAYAKFGVSKGENAEGTNIWSNYIQMQNDGGHLSVYSDGQFRFQNLNDIIFESEGWAPGYGYFSVTTTEPHIFNNNKGQFTFKRKGSDYKIHFINGATDHDLIMGNAMIRSSFVQGYNNGLQIKGMMGQGWKDIELRTLRANEDISAVGQMWAKAFNPTSARNMKENIKDIPFSALDKIMSLAIKQYNFKDDMYDLYQMRVNKPEEQTEPYTTKEIETYFGMIADDTEDIFTDKEKRAINLYNTVSIFIAAFQQQYHEFNEKLTTVKSENKQLKEQVTTLAMDVSTLTDLVRKLIGEKPEQP